MVVRDDTRAIAHRVEDFLLRRIVGPGIGNAKDPHFTVVEGSLSARVLLPDRPREKVLRDFWVISENDRPRWVVKVPTLAADGKVAAEHVALTRLRVDPDIAVVPRPLCALGRGFVMSYLTGLDLPDLLRNQNWAGVEQISLDVVRRIALMHRQWATDDSADTVLAQAASIANTGPGVLDFVRPYLAGCQVGMVHGDLGPWNIRIDQERGTVGFLDWEDTKPLGLLAIDLLAFVYTLPLVVHPQYTRLGFDWLYDTALVRDQPLIDLIVQMFTAYGEITGQPAGHLARLLPLFCQYMINRISAEGRDPSRFFFGPFRQRFIAEELPWLATLPTKLESR